MLPLCIIGVLLVLKEGQAQFPPWNKQFQFPTSKAPQTPAAQQTRPAFPPQMPVMYPNSGMPQPQQRSPWGMPTNNQFNQFRGVMPNPMTGGVPGAMPGGVPGAMPPAMPNPMTGARSMSGGMPGVMPSPMPNAMASGLFPGFPTAAGGMPPYQAPAPSPGVPGRCVATFHQPRLCAINGENQHKYTLQAVINMLKDAKIEKVPQCVQRVPRVNCADYNAAQYIWKKGYCYCKRYHNNLSSFMGMPPLRCVLNNCGGCSQQFYLGKSRIVDCD